MKAPKKYGHFSGLSFELGNIKKNGYRIINGRRFPLFDRKIYIQCADCRKEILIDKFKINDDICKKRIKRLPIGWRRGAYLWLCPKCIKKFSDRIKKMEKENILSKYKTFYYFPINLVYMNWRML